jgi:hypothetical protein
VLDSGKMIGGWLEADQQTRSSSFGLVDGLVQEKALASEAPKKS